MEADTLPSLFSQIRTESMLKDIHTFSDPRFQGRQAGTWGALEAGSCIQERFQALASISAPSSFSNKDLPAWTQQTFLPTRSIQAPARVDIGFMNPATESSEPTLLHIGHDYLPILDSSGSHVTAPVVFVGYGIIDPSRGLDHYQGLEVQNRIVLFLRGRPPEYPQWVSHEEKVQNAKEKGAAGYITVTGPSLDPYEARKGLGQNPLALYAATPNELPIPGIWISGAVMDGILQSFHESLKSLQQSANHAPTFRAYSLPLVATLHWETRSETGMLTNVIGLLPGQHPTLRDEWILIGAHRDHFGLQAGLLFPGADDNASGTAVMLEMARLFAQDRFRLKRSLLFVSFDGEERGLLGSTLYLTNPAVPKERTVAMINLDHLSVGNGELTVGVTRMSRSAIQQAAEQAGLGSTIRIYGFFPGGDHVPFYEAGVPTVTVVSGGTHPHFHQPSDTAASIQPEVLSTSAKFLASLLWILGNEPLPRKRASHRTDGSGMEQ